MKIQEVSEKHLDGLEMALLILTQRKEKSSYENEQLIRFLMNIARRNGDE